MFKKITIVVEGAAILNIKLGSKGSKYKKEKQQQKHQVTNHENMPI